MDARTVGVEEELVLVDPESRRATARSPEVLKFAAERTSARGADILDHELFQHQLETRTPPVTDLSELRSHIIHARRVAAEAAAGAGLLTIATGTVPLAGGEPRPTRDDRYLAMIETFGEIARPGGTCGMHVHVRVADEEEGVGVIDRIVPWLPVLLAVSANSPYFHGRDTGYASWRSQVWSQWPSAGPTERFGSVERYHEVSRRLIASGAAQDEGMLYFDARLSRHQPTVEVRISDVCTDPDEAIFIAALVRALVARTAADGPDGPLSPGDVPWRSELLRAAQWRAARHGLSDRLLDPRTGALAPARPVLEALVELVRDQLDASGDADLVADGVGRVLAENGAGRQRAAFERSGGDLATVVDDLVRRTNACWRG